MPPTPRIPPDRLAPAPRLATARPPRVMGVVTTPRVPRLAGGQTAVARAGGKAPTTSKRGGSNGKKTGR